MRHQTIIRCVIKIQLLHRAIKLKQSESNFSAFILFIIMRDDKSVTSFWENTLAGSTPVLCRYTFTDLNFSAFTLLKQAIRDNVSDTSNLQSKLITQPETSFSVSLSLVRQVISKELLRHILECNHPNTLYIFSLPLFANPFLAYIVCELYRCKCA